jgi:inhibitor of KinA sporulation pathway (predicted exonuclease)
MLYIFVDLEMNPVDSVHVEEHKICSTEIIEIGAVMLDDGFKEIDSFKKFVKPKYSANISSICRSLTGIRDENLAGAGGFNDAMEDFIAWCLGHGEEYRIYSWSDSDRLQICTEMKLKGYDKSEYTDFLPVHFL